MSGSENGADLPAGEYAIVELFGHTTLVGRIAEVERFGAKMLAIEPLFRGALLPVIFHGGASIYRLTPCSPKTAAAHQPAQAWALPPAVRTLLPRALIEDARDAELDEQGGDDAEIEQADDDPADCEEL